MNSSCTPDQAVEQDILECRLIRNIRGQGSTPGKIGMWGAAGAEESQSGMLTQVLRSAHSLVQYCSVDIWLVMESSLEDSLACEFCRRSFGRQEHLDRHVRSHSNHRPFRCDGCHRHFSRRYVTYERPSEYYISGLLFTLLSEILETAISP
jgi:hypothetical protein